MYCKEGDPEKRINKSPQSFCLISAQIGHKSFAQRQAKRSNQEMKLRGKKKEGLRGEDGLKRSRIGGRGQTSAMCPEARPKVAWPGKQARTEPRCTYTVGSRKTSGPKKRSSARPSRATAMPNNPPPFDERSSASLISCLRALPCPNLEPATATLTVHPHVCFDFSREAPNGSALFITAGRAEDVSAGHQGLQTVHRLRQHATVLNLHTTPWEFNRCRRAHPAARKTETVGTKSTAKKPFPPSWPRTRARLLSAAVKRVNFTAKNG